MDDTNNQNLHQPKLTMQIVADFLGTSVQYVYKKAKDEGVKFPRTPGNRAFLDYNSSREYLKLKFKHRKIASQIVKGGTGKTTSVHNISCCANAYGAKVLVVDADPQGNLTDAHGIDPEERPVLIDIIRRNIPVREALVNVSEGLDIIPSRIENVILDNEIVNSKMSLQFFYENILGDLDQEYDFIFIDCPPTMGQAVTAATLYCDTVLAPLNPDKFSAKGLKILILEIENLRNNFRKDIHFKVFLNKFNHNRMLSEKAVSSLLSRPDTDQILLRTSILYAQEIQNLADENMSVFSKISKSSTREDFDRLTRELLDINPEDRDLTKSVSDPKKDFSEVFIGE